jgi:hypothetical protein
MMSPYILSTNEEARLLQESSTTPAQELSPTRDPAVESQSAADTDERTTGRPAHTSNLAAGNQLEGDSGSPEDGQKDNLPSDRTESGAELVEVEISRIQPQPTQYRLLSKAKKKERDRVLEGYGGRTEIVVAHAVGGTPYAYRLIRGQLAIDAALARREQKVMVRVESADPLAYLIDEAAEAFYATLPKTWAKTRLVEDIRTFMAGRQQLSPENITGRDIHLRTQLPESTVSECLSYSEAITDALLQSLDSHRNDPRLFEFNREMFRVLKDASSDGDRKQILEQALTGGGGPPESAWSIADQAILDTCLREITQDGPELLAIPKLSTDEY